MCSFKKLYYEHTWKSKHLDWQMQEVLLCYVCFVLLCCFIWTFCHRIQIGLILYTSIKRTSCKITCALKKNYWKVLLPCHFLSSSRGRTEKSVSGDQNCSRPKQRNSYSWATDLHSAKGAKFLLPKAREASSSKWWTNAWQGAVGKEKKCYQHAPSCHWHRQHVW